MLSDFIDDVEKHRVSSNLMPFAENVQYSVSGIQKKSVSDNKCLFALMNLNGTRIEFRLIHEESEALTSLDKHVSQWLLAFQWDELCVTFNLSTIDKLITHSPLFSLVYVEIVNEFQVLPQIASVC